jgi:outer membrane protein assembly factor BamB
MSTLASTLRKFGNRAVRPSSGEARAPAIVSASVVVIVVLVMLVSYQRGVAEDPLRVSALKDLRDQLHLAPKDEALKAKIRARDLQQRERYFKRVKRNEIGRWLLAGGAAVFVWSSAKWFGARKQPFMPRPLTPATEVARDNTRGRVAIVGVSAAIVVASAIIGVTQRVQLTAAPKGTTSSGPVTSGVTFEAMRQNWPQFRGAETGLSSATNIPVKWDVASGENIAWKITPPLPGVSSPVVWSNRLFLTAADKTSRELLCFDTANGALLWRLPVTLATAEAVTKMEIPELTGAAIATPAIDGQHVFAIFATGELIAANNSGRLAWSKNFGKPINPYGHATSLVLWRDKLIVQLDQGDHEANKSKLYALDVATGNIAWETARPHIGATWGTPITFKFGGRDQLVCVGTDLISYDPATGRELWRCKGFDGELCPSPTFGAGFVFAVIPGQQLFAIRADGSGDVTASHITWKTNNAIPDINSPVCNGELLFTMETYGMLTCYDAKSGAKLWDHQYEGEFQASPTIAGDKLFLFTTEGDGIVVRAGKKFEELGRSKFGEAIKATPAFMGNNMFVRGATNLFCIMAKGAAK